MKKLPIPIAAASLIFMSISFVHPNRELSTVKSWTATAAKWAHTVFRIPSRQQENARLIVQGLATDMFCTIR